MTALPLPSAPLLRRPARPPLSLALPGRYAGRRVHFVGVGGVGMSGLARVLLDAGAVVTGTDPSPNAQTLALAAAGAGVRREQDGRLVTADVDFVVHTAAVRADNPELVSAGRHGLRVVGYAELLGEVMGDRLGVAVAGTHGKSTTSAMVAHALSECGGDPSFVIGGHVPQLGGGSRSGTGPAFVAEACEFDRSFHRLRPTVAVITNVEEDHLDYYRDLDEIVAAFRHFAALVPGEQHGGAVVCNGDDASTLRAVAGPARRPDRRLRRPVRLADRRRASRARPARRRADARREDRRTPRARRARPAQPAQRRPRRRRRVARGGGRRRRGGRRRVVPRRRPADDRGRPGRLALGRRRPARRSSTTTATTRPRSSPRSPPCASGTRRAASCACSSRTSTAGRAT